MEKCFFIGRKYITRDIETNEQVLYLAAAVDIIDSEHGSALMGNLISLSTGERIVMQNAVVVISGNPARKHFCLPLDGKFKEVYVDFEVTL